MSSNCNCRNNSTQEEKFDNIEVILTIFGVVLFVVSILINDISELLSLIGYVVSYACIGYEIVFEAFKKLFKRDMFDENFLMVIATIGAFIIGEYTEAIAVILLYKIGEFLQYRAVENSKKKISEVIDIRTNIANIKINNEIKSIDPQKLKIGDIIVVKTGEKVPVDGILLSKDSKLDMSLLTGESRPINIKNKQEILSGAINIGSVIEIEVTKTFENSAVSTIINMIKDSNIKKSNTERFITRFAKIYTPIVTLIAVIIAILPIFTNLTYIESLHRAFTFLVISCPCALVISIPLGFFVGIGSCSKKGILVKGSNYLDILTKTKTVVFDKTGTLTKGAFEVTKIITSGNMTEEQIIQKIAMCEHYSNHYIAKSILNYYNKKIDTNEILSHEEIAGKGLKVKTNKEEILVGNYSLMKENNIEVNEQKEGSTVVHLSINSKYEGCVILSDVLKEDSKELINELKKVGIKKFIMLTGDSEKIAQNIADKVGIKEVYSNLLPENKLEIFKKIKNNNENIVYLGDGINDSPVLVASDVGIAMGRGADIATELSDIVFITDEPSKLVDAIRIARKTKKVVKGNIVFVILIKILFLILSGLGLTSMWFAIFADVGVALITILNSFRIFFSK